VFSQQAFRKLVAIAILSALSCLTPPLVLADEEKAYTHLYEVMDKFHTSFDVYTDQDAGGNHFYPSGWMGDISSVSFDSNWTSNPRTGTSCIKITFQARSNNWAGIYWQEPENNWGIVPNGGYDITGATNLTFWARGENGGERVEFFAGGITGPYPDSLPKTSTGYITLTNSWQRYTIGLTGKNLSHVIGGFGWVANSSHNPNGATFYLDDIRYDKFRPDDLRFLVSFETLPFVNPDRYIRNVSFVYDNALALLAFLARGGNEDLRRAKILADSFVYAQNNDRYYSDSRLRNAYMSGDLRDHLTGKVKISGWWDPIDEEWYEDKFQVSTHTGNLAWTIIALLSYYEKKGGTQYLEAAETMGEWIEWETMDTGGPGGYTGGYEGWEPAPQKITWKSTEHNIDVYVAFMRLSEITGDEKWKEGALHAKSFVEAMWDEAGRYFWTGTLEDGVTINKSNIPLDIQAWAIMAFGGYSSGIFWAENNCYTEADGFKGFDFNDDRDGIWFEGTAQMAIAYQVVGEATNSDLYLSELSGAQASAPNANGKGMVAASHDGVSTGFDWEYFSRLHIGATAWYILAEREYNPFWGTKTTIAHPSPGSFVDVALTHWAFDYINAIYDAGVTTGYGDGTYGPEDPVSREQMAAFIIRALSGEIFSYNSTPYFVDVPSSHWAFKYIQKLKELGITTGCGYNQYCPEEFVTRDQMAAFLVRATTGEEFSYSSTPYFTDVHSDHWAFDYIQKLKELGITTGCGSGRYCPYDFLTRDQMAAFLWRAFLQ
jgi:hypothetical protein